MKNFWRMMVVLTAAILPATAQVWDFTGDNLLSGSYVFRELIMVNSTPGSVARAISLTGTMIFNSASRSYSISASYVDSSNGASSYTDVGGYSIAPNGYGFMDHPFLTSGSLHGLVSNGVFVGSSTEAGINDIFIAVPAGSATNATLSGNYTMDYYQVGGTSANSWDSVAQLTANGGGSIGTVAVKTYVGNSTTTVNQNEAGVTYSFSSGIGTMNFPTSGQPAIGGPKQLLISPDGNFIFGGSTSTTTPVWDFFVGVRRATGAAPTLSGLYYQAGLSHSPGALDTFYGAFNARSGLILEHQRYFSSANAVSLNYTASAVYTENATDYSDGISNVDYTISADGRIRIGAGQSPYLGLRIAVQGPSFTAPSSAPFINPTGVINAASYAPFTTGVAPGELMSIYGENLSGSTIVAPAGVPFPNKLGDVQVLFNNVPAALYFVSSGQIAALVPFGISGSVVQIQVVRGGVNSNAVTAFRYLTSPGIYSLAASGEGLGAVLHPDYSVVTEQNPAKVGETVQIFLTGLGQVFPTIADGSFGSGDPNNLNLATGSVKVYIGNVLADVGYAGLAPGLPALYQVNATVPSGAGSGNVFLDIGTADSYTTQVALPVAAASSSDTVVGQKTEPKAPAHRR